MRTKRKREAKRIKEENKIESFFWSVTELKRKPIFGTWMEKKMPNDFFWEGLEAIKDKKKGRVKR